MPRTADHQARRRQIVDGVRRVAVTDGLSRVTMAGAAREAGVSVGLVQHYYSSKEDLLVDTVRSVHEDIEQRVDAAVARAERRFARIEQMMAAGLQQLFPLDDRRREETRLRHSFAGLALENERLHEHQRRFDESLAARAAQAVRNGLLCGEVLPGTDPDQEGYAVISLADGLAARLLMHAGRRQRAWARAAVTARMAAVFPGPCARESKVRDADADAV
ncbi:MAG: TetR family transcriptional regulator [Propionibacteriales bacterium]|nr:TetR family transcriptional regulator [Propionibacteriales bacterium]